MSHHQQLAFRKLRRVSDADRDHSIARVQRLQRWRAGVLDREILAEHERKACQQQECGTIRSRTESPRLAMNNRDRCRRGEHNCHEQDGERANPRPRHFVSLLLLLLVVSDAPGATPSSASGSLGSLAVACCAAFAVSSWLDRLIAEAKSTMMKAAARPVSPMRMRCALVPAW